MDIIREQPNNWPLWRKIIFRFLFIYLALHIMPLGWFNVIPLLPKYYYQFWTWIVTLANDHLFHLRKTLVPPNGSGDTSLSWVSLSFTLLLAGVGCLIWSAIDYKRNSYNKLNYWLCLFVRYFISMYAFVYGIVKLFALQMLFPSLHELATPLGDYLPMRLSWQFIGYSQPYQVFSGVMEVSVGLLLLYRRTVTLGLVVGLAVFVNVMALNLCYDIPVKIFSTQLVFTCLFLLAHESNRLLAFFVLNKPAAPSTAYQFNYTGKYMRIGRVVFKVLFIFLAICLATYKDYGYYQYVHRPVSNIIKNGFYNVSSYTVNHKPASSLLADTLVWQDVILENGTGSLKTCDTIFSHRYQRAYFEYVVDSLNRNIDFKRKDREGTTSTLFTLHYEQPDSSTLKLWGKKGVDSLQVELKRTKRHYQLAEKQFHWIIEYNK
jgi:hypothetical protein